MKRFFKGLFVIFIWLVAVALLTPLFQIVMPILWVLITGADLPSDRVARNIEAFSNICGLSIATIAAFKVRKRLMVTKKDELKAISK